MKKLSPAFYFNHLILKLLLIFLTWEILIYSFAFVATKIFPLQDKFTAGHDFGLQLPYLLWIWGNFDGTHYMEVARNGYHALEYAFFPLYPILIKFLFETFKLIGVYLPYLISAQIISNLAFLLSLFVIYKILTLDRLGGLLPLIVGCIILFPTSYSYGAAYNDSLFFLFATLTIYFARKRLFVLSSIMGALATLTRLNGIALVFIVLLEYYISNDNIINQWNIRTLIQKAKKALEFREMLSKKIFAVFLIPLSFLGYLLYVHIWHGNWNLVFSSMEVWNQSKLTFPLQVFWRYLKIFFLSPAVNLTYWVTVLELLFVLFYIFIIIYSYKKIRLSYWAFFVISIIIPPLTGTFAGMPRYALHLYPFFLGLSLFLSNRNIFFKAIYFTISAFLLFLFIGLFTRGYFIA